MRLVLTVILIALNATLILKISDDFSNTAIMLAAIFSYAVILPALVTALLCIPEKYRNRNIIFRVFNIISFIMVLAAIPKVSGIYTSPPYTISDKQELIEITLPGSWREGEPAKENISLSLKNQQGETTIIIIADEIGNKTSNTIEYAQKLAERFSHNKSVLSSTPLEICTVDHFECIYQEASIAYGDNNTVTLLATIKGNKYFFNFFGSTSQSLYEDTKPELLEILASIREK